MEFPCVSSKFWHHRTGGTAQTFQGMRSNTFTCDGQVTQTSILDHETIPSCELTHIPPMEKENHLQNYLGRGDVSSQEGSLFFILILFDFWMIVCWGIEYRCLRQILRLVLQLLLFFARVFPAAKKKHHTNSATAVALPLKRCHYPLVSSSVRLPHFNPTRVVSIPSHLAAPLA